MRSAAAIHRAVAGVALIGGCVALLGSCATPPPALMAAPVAAPMSASARVVSVRPVPAASLQPAGVSTALVELILQEPDGRTLSVVQPNDPGVREGQVVLLVTTPWTHAVSGRGP